MDILLFWNYCEKRFVIKYFENIKYGLNNSFQNMENNDIST